jgi:hypothetical protein
VTELDWESRSDDASSDANFPWIDASVARFAVAVESWKSSFVSTDCLAAVNCLMTAS